ncbi:S66 peptidase family protein [Paenibacillus pasadenensis]|uniref:S66 peptidase family protein n=1 Tax=Paenibacillus pasadenensis TaxID=217090 RepID=UPI000416863E|nr:LD-carboxypeptidase [Paenibacillus pasadenensis]
MMLRPPALKPGDTVGIPALASPGDPAQIEAASRQLERLGLRVRLGRTVSLRRGYLAGSDEERADELMEMFADPSISGIVCARGGYGTARIADRLDYGVIRAHPKAFWGYSDITFLHAAIGRLAGLVTFHGPMMIDLQEQPAGSGGFDHARPHPVTLEAYRQLLAPRRPQLGEEHGPLRPIVPGEASGPVVGGNLTLIVSTLGTRYELDTRGRLLLLEDIDEEPYRVDRMLMQLRQAGKLDDAAGIVVGDFHNCGPAKRKASLSLDEVLQEHLGVAGKPALAGFRIGHGSPQLAVPLGVEARLSTAERRLDFAESGWAEDEAASGSAADSERG